MQPQDITVVVVDDERDNLEVYQRMLAGYRVRAFSNPGEALDAVVHEAPACMLVDYRMPELNGVELIRRCRAAGFDGPTLMVTAFPDLDEVVFAQQVDLVYSIVPKPVSIPHLKDKVDLLIADSRFRKAFDGRRRCSRFDIRLEVGVNWGDGWQTATSRNVSHGGMLLDAQPPSGSHASIQLRIKHSTGMFETTARVVHADARGTGIVFVDPPAQFREALGDIITRFRYDPDYPEKS